MLKMERTSRIQVLSPAVVNKIAAGEVIERPASVVKELLENSLDALCSRIDVEIEEGGTELIRIVDDGEGIVPADLPLAVTSHATSKLKQADDLFCVQTMGFRGEALASIAEVSQFRIRSRAEGETVGAELSVNCGQRGEITPCGMAPGTQMEVRQLFCNTPVRRKFLKKASTEFGYISEQFTRVALACPRLQMSLTHNGKQVYRLPGQQPLKDRIELFFGSSVVEKLIPVETSHNGIRLWGYVGHPSLHKSTRKSQYLYLNGRFIQDRTLQHALIEAYRGLLMVGRYPVAFLFLEMPSDQADVNVHPTKAEVRFRDSQLLFRMLHSTLKTQFLQSDLHSELTIRQPAQQTREPADKQRQVELDLVSWAKTQLEQRIKQQPQVSAEHLATFKTESDSTSEPVISGQSTSDKSTSVDSSKNWQTESPDFPESFSPEKRGSDQRNAFSSGTSSLWGQDPETSSAKPLSENTSHFPEETEAQTGRQNSQSSADFPVEEKSVSQAPDSGQNSAHNQDSSTQAAVPTGISGTASRSGIPALQVDDCYLVLSTDQGLTVIDQHALHERVLYERFRKKVLEERIEVQKLLVPLTLELSEEQIGVLLGQQELLQQMGFCVEEFGRGMIAVSSHPVFLGRQVVETVIRELAEKLDNTEQVSRRDLLDSSLHMMACKAAIKAGQKLTPEEIISLLAQREMVEDAHHCPHGRPTALVLSREELDRQFGRLGA